MAGATDYRTGEISIGSLASAVKFNRDFASGYAPQNR